MKILMARCAFLAVFISLSILFFGIEGQQLYSQDFSEDCDNYHAESSGYLCNGVDKQCRTFATYRAQENFMSLTTIAQLLDTHPATIANTSNFSIANYSAPLGKDQLVLFPIDCKSAGNFYQANLTYTVKDGDIYLNIANYTLEGLTTCQAMIEQNPTHDENSLDTGMKLVAPLRCACPTAEQAARGVKYLLSYIADPLDDDDIISIKFNISHDDFISANKLKEPNPTIYPYTTLLIPLNQMPVVPPSGLFAPPPATPIPPGPPVVFKPPSGSSHSYSFIVPLVAALCGTLVIVAAIRVLSFLYLKKKKRTRAKVIEDAKKSQELRNAETPNESILLLSEMSDVLKSDKLIGYTFKELQEATDNFSSANKIKGSVFQGILRGKRVAIKQMKGQVSPEINMLHQFHHANLVTLLGICISGVDQHIYLVLEYAENGSLSDWIHGSNKSLGWNQRLQITLDIAEALEYLHHGTSPSCVHKDIKSSNILLDKSFRAKIANFGLAKSGAGPAAITSHILGTHGYMAPEFLRDGLVTPKLDVFAFAVVVLEILSGKKAVSSNVTVAERLLSEEIREVMRGENAKEKLSDWIDPRIEKGSYDLEVGFKVASLAISCVEKDLTLRPSMTEVRMDLSKLVGISTAHSSQERGGGYLSISSEFQPR